MILRSLAYSGHCFSFFSMKDPEDVELTSAVLRPTLVSRQDGDVGTARVANGPLRERRPILRHSRSSSAPRTQQPPAGSRALACSPCAARIASRGRRHGTNPPPDKDHCRGSNSPRPARNSTLHGDSVSLPLHRRIQSMRYNQVLSYSSPRISFTAIRRRSGSISIFAVPRNGDESQCFNVTLAILRHQKEVKCGWGRPDHHQAFAVRRFQRRRRVTRIGDVY